MILVLLGTQHNEFKRLLQEIEDCIDNKFINDRVVVQAGFTKYETKKMEVFDTVSLTRLNELIEEADIIISHGGVGSITLALKKGKKVIAVPRLSKYGEHVNDHQRQIVNAFNEKGYIIGIQDVRDLSEGLKLIQNFKPKEYKENNQKLIQTVEEFIDNV